MAFGSDNDVEIRIRVDAEGAISLIDKTGKSLETLGTQTKKAGDGFNKAQASIVAFNQGLQGLRAGFGAVEKLSSAFNKLVERGDKFNDLMQGFKTFGGSAKMFADAQRAVNGLATDTQLLQVANRALVAGVPGLTQNFSALVEATTKLAESTGNDVVPALDAVTSSLVAGNARALKSLGIKIDQTKAEADFAKSIGTTAKQLNEAGKLEAVRVAIQSQLIAKARELPEAEKGVADTLETIRNKASNLLTALGSDLDNDKGLIGAFKGVQKAIDDIDPKAFISKLSGAVSGTVGYINMLTDPKQYAGGGDVGRGISTLRTWAMSGFGLTLSQAAQVTALKEFKDQVAAGQAKGQSFAETVKNMMTPALDKTGDAAEGAAKKIGKLKSEISNPRQYIKGGGAGGLTRGSGMLDQIFGMFDPAAAKLNADGTAQTFAQAFGESLKTDLASSIAGAFKSISANGVTAQGVKDMVNDLSVTIATAAGGASGVPGAGAITGGYASFIVNALLGIGKSGASTASSIFKLNASQLALVTGGASFIFSQIADSLTNRAFGGGRNEEQNARKAINKWWKEIFKDTDDVKLIIEGQVKKVRDLFQHETEKGVYNSGKGGAFGGTGSAFAALFGDEKLNGEQLNNILEANVGNLNNLQLMLQAAKIDSEDFGKALEEAYLYSGMSAKDFLRASKDIEDVYAAGIPGAVGATGQALDNFRAGALTSGQIAKDGLVDLAAEAKEAHLSTIGELEQSLIDQGKMTTEEARKFFDELNAQGIDTLEQLANVTTKQTAQITTDLESAGFAFEEPTEKLATMKEYWDSINSKAINLDVTLNMSDDDRSALELIRSGGSGGSDRSSSSGGWTGFKMIAGAGSNIDWGTTTSVSESSGGYSSDYGSSSSSSGPLSKSDIMNMFQSGQLSAKQAANRIAKLNSASGGGLPGIGNIAGAIKQMQKGKGRWKGFAGLKNLLFESQEGGVSLGQLLTNIDLAGGNTSKLRDELAAHKVTTIDAAVRIDDSELIGIFNQVRKGLTLNIKTNTLKTPGAGKKNRKSPVSLAAPVYNSGI